MKRNTALKLLLGLVIFFSFVVLFVNRSVPTSRAEERIPFKPKSTVESVQKLFSDLFGGISSSEDLTVRCERLAELDKIIKQNPEIEKYLAENPEYNEQGGDGMISLRNECLNANIVDEGDLDPSRNLNLDPSSPLPAGRCTAVATAAVKKVMSNKYLIDTYKKASEATNVPWEILAAIHYVEAGNNPNSSLISGRPIGFPEPDQGMNRYSSLLETAIVSGNVFKEKRSLAMKSTGAGPEDFMTLVNTFTRYNGPGNTQCKGSSPKALAPGYDGCPAKFEYEDHIYPLACYDKRHEDMYLIYCGDGTQCARPKLFSNIGALTFIKALKDVVDPPQIGPVDRPATTVTRTLDELVYYPQCNGSEHRGSWANQNMTDSRGRSIGCTYCFASCGLTSSAMIVSSYANQSINPVRFLASYNTTQNMSCEGANMGTLRSTMKKFGVNVGGAISFGVPISDPVFIRHARSYLQNGWTLLTLGYFNSVGHYVWIVGIDDQNRFLIYDPYWGVNSPLPFNSKNYTSARITYITPVRK